MSESLSGFKLERRSWVMGLSDDLQAIGVRHTLGD
jgi:hypothetical protein